MFPTRRKRKNYQIGGAAAEAIHIFTTNHHHLANEHDRQEGTLVFSILYLHDPQRLQGITPTANRVAMSKALGAAFLNHQVEQLEKSVSNGPNGNWRDRRYHISQAQDHTRAANNNRRTPGNGALRTAVKPTQKGYEKLDSVQDRGKKEDGGADKDADIVILDASVLIHALPNVKKWCRDGRQEVVIVPLEGPFRFPFLDVCFHRLYQLSIHSIFSRKAPALLHSVLVRRHGSWRLKSERTRVSVCSGTMLSYSGTKSPSRTMQPSTS